MEVKMTMLMADEKDLAMLYVCLSEKKYSFRYQWHNVYYEGKFKKYVKLDAIVKDKTELQRMIDDIYASDTQTEHLEVFITDDLITTDKEATMIEDYIKEINGN